MSRNITLEIIIRMQLRCGALEVCRSLILIVYMCLAVNLLRRILLDRVKKHDFRMKNAAELSCPP